ncbi:hypothetical protein HK096_003918 [Nowakowskiella sp. JEL0078]|nr:hypothetical protein HK096_003918 [Nowakowskiella sp. JEL0078]
MSFFKKSSSNNNPSSSRSSSSHSFNIDISKQSASTGGRKKISPVKFEIRSALPKPLFNDRSIFLENDFPSQNNNHSHDLIDNTSITRKSTLEDYSPNCLMKSDKSIPNPNSEIHELFGLPSGINKQIMMKSDFKADILNQNSIEDINCYLEKKDDESRNSSVSLESVRDGQCRNFIIRDRSKNRNRNYEINENQRGYDRNDEKERIWQRKRLSREWFDNQKNSNTYNFEERQKSCDKFRRRSDQNTRTHSKTISKGFGMIHDKHHLDFNKLSYIPRFNRENYYSQNQSSQNVRHTPSVVILDGSEPLPQEIISDDKIIVIVEKSSNLPSKRLVSDFSINTETEENESQSNSASNTVDQRRDVYSSKKLKPNTNEKALLRLSHIYEEMNVENYEHKKSSENHIFRQHTNFNEEEKTIILPTANQISQSHNMFFQHHSAQSIITSLNNDEIFFENENCNSLSGPLSVLHSALWRKSTNHKIKILVNSGTTRESIRQVTGYLMAFDSQCNMVPNNILYDVLEEYTVRTRIKEEFNHLEESKEIIPIILEKDDFALELNFDDAFDLIDDFYDKSVKHYPDLKFDSCCGRRESADSIAVSESTVIQGSTIDQYHLENSSNISTPTSSVGTLIKGNEIESWRVETRERTIKQMLVVGKSVIMANCI